MDSRITKETKHAAQFMPIWESCLGLLEGLEVVLINVLLHQPYPDQKELKMQLTDFDVSNLAFW